MHQIFYQSEKLVLPNEILKKFQDKKESDEEDFSSSHSS